MQVIPLSSHGEQSQWVTAAGYACSVDKSQHSAEPAGTAAVIRRVVEYGVVHSRLLQNSVIMRLLLSQNCCGQQSGR